MLRWGRRYRHVSDALVNYNEQNVIWVKVGLAGHAFRMRVSIGFLSLSSLLTPVLLSPTRRAFLVATAASLNYSCLFHFLLVARLCYLWKTSIMCSILGLPRRLEIWETFEGVAIDGFYIFYKRMSPLAGSQALNKFNEGCMEESPLTKVSLNP